MMNSACSNLLDSETKQICSVAITTVWFSYWWHGCSVTCHWHMRAPQSGRALKQGRFISGNMDDVKIGRQQPTTNPATKDGTSQQINGVIKNVVRLSLLVNYHEGDNFWHYVTSICSTMIERLVDIVFTLNLCSRNWREESRVTATVIRHDAHLIGNTHTWAQTFNKTNDTKRGFLSSTFISSLKWVSTLIGVL